MARTCEIISTYSVVMETDLSKLIKYSEKYCDSQYEYRHVSLPEAISRKVGH